MKKVLLTAMALLTIASTSVFGMYGSDSSWIDFLVHGNQLRARMNQFGFVLGNDTIRGTFGFKSEGTPLGAIFNGTIVQPAGSTDSKQFLNFIPTISAGIGYTSEVFSIGVGYNYKYMHTTLQNISIVSTGGAITTNNYTMTKNNYGLSIHTPVVTMTALNNNLRIAIPVQIAVKNGDVKATDTTMATDKSKYIGISMDPQIRYYTGLETLTQLRLYVKYGMNQAEVEFTGANKLKEKAESFGFDFRAYFGATVGDVALSPFIKVTYNTLLNAKGKLLYNAGTINAINVDTTGLEFGYGSVYDKYGISAGSAYVLQKITDGGYEHNPWQLQVLPTLGLTANSDIVSIYVEAALGYRATDTGYKFDKVYGGGGVIHDMRWSAYGEVYITPIKDLEWYFEAEIGNATTDVYRDAQGVQFNASTGITWYLPAL